MRRILVVEDDAKTAASIELYLRHDGFTTDLARSGPEALQRAAAAAPDLVVLDLMLPGLDGIEVCRRLRANGNVPIIMLTARGAEEDKLSGLDAGADDYVTKPFSPRELVARVQAVLRRAENVSRPKRIEAGDLILDEDAHEATLRGEPLDLTAAELRLLTVLVQSAGRVFTREELLRRVFGDEPAALERTIDVHIKNLRRKIESDRSNPTRIVTVYGAGYRFVR
jgi:DNA-binding response OmpR family regulator